MSKKSKEISALPAAELTAKVSDLRRELIKLKAQAKTTGMKNTSLIRETKKAIARALTFANKKKGSEKKETRKSEDRK